jgi:serine/threonine-protein kinase RsbW
MQRLILPATLDSLARISQFIEEATAQAGLDDHAAWQVQLAVDEAATNIIQHGYAPGAAGTVELGWEIAGDELIVTLRDHGRGFNPDDVPPPDIESPLEERQPGGLGLYLMGRLMDDVQFQFDAANGNLLTMIKRLSGAPHPPADPTISVFELSGRLDAISTDEALRPVRAAVAAGARRLLLNLGGVTFMSSSGLRALLLLRKELLGRGGELRLCGMSREVFEVFELTGFTQVFAIHTSCAAAMAAFAARRV